jgi:pyruvate dehydrogenase E2 component (dihydrolipoamide acetyltransferase)
MATPVTMPRQGNTVESCVIQEWFKKQGDKVTQGEPLLSFETDKASFELEAPASGILLKIFFDKDADVPVLTNIAVIGQPGDTIDQFMPQASAPSSPAQSAAQPSPVNETPAVASQATAPVVAADVPQSGDRGISPRARNLASSEGIETSSIQGTGPKGRVIERDVKSAAETAPKLTKAAQATSKEGKGIPQTGSGIGGRVRLADLTAAAAVQGAAPVSGQPGNEDTFKEVAPSNMRRIIGTRMMESLQQSAQLTLHSSANATALLAYRQVVKAQREKMDIADINITDLIVFAVSRILPKFPEMNALFANEKSIQYTHAHVALAVDTPRGLIVPVIRFADMLSLNDIARSCKSLAKQAQEGSINPDLLNGGTFTVSNLGNFGIEFFTPVLNRPQVGLLGVNTIQLKPVSDGKDGYTMAPHIGLSLTFDHRAIDGAGAARFLKTLVNAIENISITIAL